VAPPFNHYLVGALVTVTGTYTNHQTGALTDPTDAKVDVVSPNGTTVTYAYTDVSTLVRRVSTGIYQFDVNTTALPGRWEYRWWSPVGTPVQTAGASAFTVDPFPF
jgi:hypothetical protein